MGLTKMEVNFKARPADKMTYSEVAEFFCGAGVLLTGGTGFLGKLTVEKLLRSCGDLERLYVLVREKKGKGIEKRREELFDNLVFDRLRRERPDFLEKVTFVHGDCSAPDLGLSVEDKKTLEKNVSVVFHFAATVRFNQPLGVATRINVRATRDLLGLARRMPKLKSFVFVSTAYSHCVLKDIGEEFYQTPITGEELISLVETSTEDDLDRLTPTLIGKWPNTYSFTKAIAEEVVSSSSHGLPVVVVRPSIVNTVLKEPIPGWIDNAYGIAGVAVGVSLGFIRVIQCDSKCISDLIPADYVVSQVIAAAWSVESEPKLFHNSDRPLIFNCVTSPQSPTTYGHWIKRGILELTDAPSLYATWYAILIPIKNYYAFKICNALFHHLPAHVVDLVALCLGKPQVFVKWRRRADNLVQSITYFTINEWNFSNQNTQSLFQRMNATDRERFFFDSSNFDWNSYLKLMVRGCRVYILKDPLDTVPQGRKKHRRYQTYHYILVSVLCVVFLWICYLEYKLISSFFTE